MNNWRLLLLAVVVVVQPIGSFTESNLIDGRECCERSEDVRFYGAGRRSLDGNREERRTTDERRLKLFDESRGWRYERSLNRLERTEIRLSLESSRYPRDQVFGRANSRKTREDLSRNRDESRSSVGQVERDSLESRSRDAFETTRSLRLSRDGRDTRSTRQSRDSLSRLPIRTRRDLEVGQVSGRDTAANNPEREAIARSGTRRDTRLTGIRSDSRIQLEDNRDRRAFDRNTQADRENQRFSNARNSEIHARMSNGKNDREVRAVRGASRRQRDIEFRARMITHIRDDVRIRDTRDNSEKVIRNRKDAIINDRLERQRRDDNRSFMDTLRNTDVRRLSSQLSRGLGATTSTRKAESIKQRLESQDRLGETRDTRLSRNSERNMRDERSSINRDETSDVRRQQRDNRQATVSTDTSLHRKQRSANNKMIDSRRVISARRDNRESSDERRQQRDNTRQKRERSVELSRDRRETVRTEESGRAIRDTSEEQRLQRDRVLNSRNQQSREQFTSDLRRVLERGMERAIRTSHSAERRQGVREIRASRSVEDIHDGTRARNNRDQSQQIRKQERTIEQQTVSTQRLVTRLLRTENNRLERAARNRNDVRRIDEKDMIDRVVVRATRNVESPQQFTSRESRTENIERLVKSRAVVTENERREVRRDDTRFDRSSESVQTELRQNNRDARKMSRNREARIDERLDSRRNHDVSSRGSERVLAERRQDDLEATRRYREKIVRNLNGIRVERIISERRQESRKRHSRDVRGDARIVEAEHREGNRIARDSRNVRDEINLEARRMLPRTQDNRDARSVREDTRGQRGDTKRTMITLQRNSLLAERLNERESRPETQDKRMTRNIERQGQRDSDCLRESRIDMRSNAVRIETSRIPLRHERFLGGAGNVDVTSDFKETEEPVGNWKLALYTLQGIYLCGLLVQMLTENGSKTKKRSFNWWSSEKNHIKVD